MNEQRAVIQQMVDALDHADELFGGNDTLVMNGAAAGRWLLEQPAVPEGMKLVPVEPTKEMIDRGRTDNSIQGRAFAEACYRAMLAAAPTPTQGETK
jgi:hypothetical protein